MKQYYEKEVGTVIYSINIGACGWEARKVIKNVLQRTVSKDGYQTTVEMKCSEIHSVNNIYFLGGLYCIIPKQDTYMRINLD